MPLPPNLAIQVDLPTPGSPGFVTLLIQDQDPVCLTASQAEDLSTQLMDAAQSIRLTDWQIDHPDLDPTQLPF